jgi:high-affinity Fe2+/Pb2+ permease
MIFLYHILLETLRAAAPVKAILQILRQKDREQEEGRLGEGDEEDEHGGERVGLSARATNAMEWMEVAKKRAEGWERRAEAIARGGLGEVVDGREKL